MGGSTGTADPITDLIDAAQNLLDSDLRRHALDRACGLGLGSANNTVDAAEAFYAFLKAEEPVGDDVRVTDVVNINFNTGLLTDGINELVLRSKVNGSWYRFFSDMDDLYDKVDISDEGTDEELVLALLETVSLPSFQEVLNS